MTDLAPEPVFAHLLRMTDHCAIFEHACLAEPRREHGYCTDDMARVLVVATREPNASGPLKGLAGKAIRFLNEATVLRRHVPQPDGRRWSLDGSTDH